MDRAGGQNSFRALIVSFHGVKFRSLHSLPTEPSHPAALWRTNFPLLRSACKEEQTLAHAFKVPCLCSTTHPSHRQTAAPAPEVLLTYRHLHIFKFGQ